MSSSEQFASQNSNKLYTKQCKRRFRKPQSRKGVKYSKEEIKFMYITTEKQVQKLIKYCLQAIIIIDTIPVYLPQSINTMTIPAAFSNTNTVKVI